MLFGAATGILGHPAGARPGRGCAPGSRSSPPAWGRGDGGHPRVSHHHAAREPDRLRTRADDLRRRSRPVRVLRKRAPSRRLPPAHQFGVASTSSGSKDLWVFGPILFNQSALVYASWALTAVIALYLARTRLGLNVRAVGEAPASADAMGINVSRLPLCPRPRRRRVGRRRRSLLQPLDHAGLDGRRHARRRRRLDRDRTRHLRLLAGRALPRRRVLVRRALCAAVRAPGSRGAR